MNYVRGVFEASPHPDSHANQPLQISPVIHSV